MPLFINRNQVLKDLLGDLLTLNFTSTTHPYNLDVKHFFNPPDGQLTFSTVQLHSSLSERNPVFPRVIDLTHYNILDFLIHNRPL